jgi:hypothetical protein
MKTRNPDRIARITQMLCQVWYQYPDLRFMQLLTYLNMFEGQEDGTVLDPFYQEDDNLYRALERELKLKVRNAREAKATGLKTTRPGRKSKRKKQTPFVDSQGPGRFKLTPED